MTGNGSAREAVIEIQGLTRRFGAKVAVNQVSLSVPRGTVFGLVGVNGAGKTTLIKHVLGLLKAATGSVRVFGLDPVADPVGVLSRVGHLLEENDLPGWMRVDELVRYMRAFYPRWDDAYAEELRRTFALDPAARVKHLSRGQRARAGLLIALAHRPDLLVLDEPSAGLDPVIRRDIMGAIVRTIAEEGRTVLFSSHLLHEVERVSDQVALIHDGQIVLNDGLDELKASHRRLTWHFEEARTQPPSLPGALAWEGGGYEWTVLCNRPAGELATPAEDWRARLVEERTPSLDEIFLARVGTNSLVEEEV
jgi:ABC-2 type transport system ATP-binding protein